MSAQIYYLTPDEVQRRRAKFTARLDMAAIAETEQQTKQWLKLNGERKPAPPLWEEMKIPKRHLRVVDIWEEADTSTGDQAG
jgi:hypothetical protein